VSGSKSGKVTPDYLDLALPDFQYSIIDALSDISSPFPDCLSALDASLSISIYQQVCDVAGVEALGLTHDHNEE
jgi:hypothetical protein